MTVDMPNIDVTDPVTAAIAWLFTFIIGMIPGEKLNPVIRSVLPIVAVLMGLLVRTVFDFVQGEPLTASLVFRGLAAGAVAVLGHSQFRELLKYLAPKKE